MLTTNMLLSSSLSISINHTHMFLLVFKFDGDKHAASKFFSHKLGATTLMSYSIRM